MLLNRGMSVVLALVSGVIFLAGDISAQNLDENARVAAEEVIVDAAAKTAAPVAPPALDLPVVAPPAPVNLDVAAVPKTEAITPIDPPAVPVPVDTLTPPAAPMAAGATVAAMGDKALTGAPTPLVMNEKDAVDIPAIPAPAAIPVPVEPAPVVAVPVPEAVAVPVVEPVIVPVPAAVAEPAPVPVEPAPVVAVPVPEAVAVPVVEPAIAPVPVAVAEPVPVPVEPAPVVAVPVPEAVAAPVPEAVAVPVTEPVVEPVPVVVEPVPVPVAVEPAPLPVEVGGEPAPAVVVVAPAAAPAAVEHAPDAAVEDAVKEALREGISPLPAPGTIQIDPANTELSALMSQEAIKRKAFEAHALQLLTDAEKAQQEKDFQQAKKLFDEAKQFLGLREGMEQHRLRIQKGIAESAFAMAMVFWKEKDWEKAKAEAKIAKRYGHPQGDQLLTKITEDEVKPIPPPPPPKELTRRNTEDFKKKDADMTRLFELGKQYFQTGEYSQAQDLFERVLKRDPYNTAAIRMLDKVARRRLDIAMMENKATRDDMVAEVRRAWNPRDYGIMEWQVPNLTPTNRGPDEYSKQRQRIIEKMKTIKIPEIDFRQANINDVIFFLQEQSVLFDKDVKEGERKGVNIVLNLNAGKPAGSAGAAPAPVANADPFAGGGAAAGDAAAPAAGSDVPPINCKAQYITLLEALDLVVTLAGLKYRVDNSVVMVVPANAPEGTIIHRMYDVLSSVDERIKAAAAGALPAGGAAANPFGGAAGGGVIVAGGIAGAGGGEDRGDWRAFFESLGVPWPQGSFIRYIQSLSKVSVANTVDNLSLFEQILQQINVLPNQVEIEARFVEALQTDVDSLGFEWNLTDDWEIAQEVGQGFKPMSTRSRMLIPGSTDINGSVTKGLRFMRDAPATLTDVGADDVLTLATVLTNPEMSLVLHALSQKKNTDLLSAPKVTTKSGSQATIKVVTEYIYPTDFEVTPITATGSGGAGVATVVGGIVQPGGFQTREVGVLLEVLPEVSQEGQMINIQLTPQVVEEPIWHNYGSQYTAPDGTVQTLPMEQPFFHVRSVTTSMLIFNGATVVMGGMITEHKNDIDDRVPLLGDVPILGRFFRSRMDHSAKRNLMIFVTARLVDPAGRPLKQVDFAPAIATP